MGWDANINDDYMPAWTELLLKYVGIPQYKSVTVKELCDAYGTKSTASINKMFTRVPEMKEELEKAGWHSKATRLLPMWLDIIFLYLGEPKGIRHLKQSMDVRWYRLLRSQGIK